MEGMVEGKQGQGNCEEETGRDNRIGITATLPVEIILAAGRVPVDLNNRFITSAGPAKLVEWAEARGMPVGLCAWIKGIYAVVHREDVPLTVFVTGGDCSNTTALMEVLVHEGRRAETFDFPYNRDRDTLQAEMARLANALGTDLDAAGRVFETLRPVRVKLAELDRLTWEEGLVTGGENHAWLVAASDFEGRPARFEERLDEFLAKAAARSPESPALRIAYFGVPPIISGLYEYLEERGARAVLNETQRAFSLPYDARNLVDAYLAYTYPYSVFHRLEDFLREVGRREVHGVIHYVQNACHRQVADKILRAECPVPVLTLEGDRPAAFSGRLGTRIDAFIEMIAP
jgi:benzoyl-CoA reductase/2-hydroxyglutaryl-CoA dehydratase subunit BcrC/BadD/HgdB